MITATEPPATTPTDPDTLDDRFLPYITGGFAWCEWCERALLRGLDEELAVLGRAVMREAFQHSWDIKLQEECGLIDDGAAMLDLAFSDPAKANERWEYLLQTDGLRGCYENGEWVSWI